MTFWKSPEGVALAGVLDTTGFGCQILSSAHAACYCISLGRRNRASALDELGRTQLWWTSTLAQVSKWTVASRGPSQTEASPMLPSWCRSIDTAPVPVPPLHLPLTQVHHRSSAGASSNTIGVCPAYILSGQPSRRHVSITLFLR